MSVDWDLSGKHTREQVTWPSKDDDIASTSIDPVDSVRIALPEGKVFRMTDRVREIILHRKGDNGRPRPGASGEEITYVQVDSDFMSVEDAYRRALSYVKQFGLPREPVEAWRRRRDKGVDPVSDKTATTEDRPLGGERGPVPYLELRSTGVDWVVSMQFFWPE